MGGSWLANHDPPMINIEFTLFMIDGSCFIAFAIFVSGPTATKLIFPAFSLISFIINCAASNLLALNLGLSLMQVN